MLGGVRRHGVAQFLKLVHRRRRQHIGTDREGLPEFHKRGAERGQQLSQLDGPLCVARVPALIVLSFRRRHVLISDAHSKRRTPVSDLADTAQNAARMLSPNLPDGRGIVHFWQLLLRNAEILVLCSAHVGIARGGASAQSRHGTAQPARNAWQTREHIRKGIPSNFPSASFLLYILSVCSYLLYRTCTVDRTVYST